MPQPMDVASPVDPADVADEPEVETPADPPQTDHAEWCSNQHSKVCDCGYSS
jgi:hypothetical protein